MSEFRQHFRYPSDLLFFNSGSMSLSPASVIDAVATEKAKYENNPTAGLFGAWEKMWQTQKNLASFFRCRPHDLYLRANVTYAMNDFIMALRLPEKSEILVSDLEYGAIVKICEHKAQIENLSIRPISLYNSQSPALATEDSILEALENSLSPNTKMVMLSHVMTGTGLKIPLKKTGQLLRERGVFFVVDGAHGAGTCDLDLDEKFIDFYGSNLHKWLMGPKGTGFGWVAPHMREHLVPRFAGWTTGDIAPYFQAFGEGDIWALRWMINSTINFSDFHGINEIINFWNTHGANKIYQAQKAVFQKTKTEVQNATGWACASDYKESLQSLLVAFRLPMKLLKPTLMADIFAEHKLVVSTPFVRGETLLRLSPNIYNTDEEIKKIAYILKNI